MGDGRSEIEPEGVPADVVRVGDQVAPEPRGPIAGDGPIKAEMPGMVVPGSDRKPIKRNR